jgi:hypothetical protein
MLQSNIKFSSFKVFKTERLNAVRTLTRYTRLYCVIASLLQVHCHQIQFLNVAGGHIYIRMACLITDIKPRECQVYFLFAWCLILR